LSGRVFCFFLEVGFVLVEFDGLGCESVELLEGRRFSIDGLLVVIEIEVDVEVDSKYASRVLGSGSASRSITIFSDFVS
jgi:hypothetical protein